METKKSPRYDEGRTPANEHFLLHLVKQNPALYKSTLQLNQRERIDVLNRWAQIASQFGNKYTAKECHRKWKNLRHTYYEWDLFFDFLKKKIQRLPPEVVTAIQVDILNCFLRREANHAQKIGKQPQQYVTSSNNWNNNSNDSNNNINNNCGNNIN